MNDKVKELIAVGASVSAHCQPCLVYHVAKAKKLGIAEDEIREAIAVGHLVGKGAMSAMQQFAAGVLEGGVSQASGCCSDVKSKGKNCCG